MNIQIFIKLIRKVTNEDKEDKKKDFDDVKFMVSKQEFMKILSADLHEDNLKSKDK